MLPLQNQNTQIEKLIISTKLSRYTLNTLAKFTKVQFYNDSIDTQWTNTTYQIVPIVNHISYCG